MIIFNGTNSYMTMQQAIDMLASSEIQKLKVKDETATLLNYLNMGILKIHERFDLIQREVLITMEEGRNTYLLDGTDPAVSFDTVDAMLMVLRAAYDYQGDEIHINDETKKSSITTPSMNEVEIPDSMLTEGQTVSLIFRCAPSFITDVTKGVPLLPQYFEPLFLYVAYKAHGAIKNGMQDESNTHYLRFDRSCKEIQENGLYQEDSLNSTKFEQRGFA